MCHHQSRNEKMLLMKEYEQYKHLRYEYMDNHERLSENGYRTTYSDGATVTVDYNKRTYSFGKL